MTQTKTYNRAVTQPTSKQRARTKLEFFATVSQTQDENEKDLKELIEESKTGDDLAETMEVNIQNVQIEPSRLLDDTM